MFGFLFLKQVVEEDTWSSLEEEEVDWDSVGISGTLGILSCDLDDPDVDWGWCVYPTTVAE